jgi:hypothetical protein
MGEVGAAGAFAMRRLALTPLPPSPTAVGSPFLLR